MSIHFFVSRNGADRCTEIYRSAQSLPEVSRQEVAKKVLSQSPTATSCRPMDGSCGLRIASGPTSQPRGYAASPASLSERAARLHEARQTRQARCSTSSYEATRGGQFYPASWKARSANGGTKSSALVTIQLRQEHSRLHCLPHDFGAGEGW